MINSLLYVSQSNLQLPEQANEIDRIVKVARSRNLALGVTGALIFTEARFAQILEGSEAALAELMASIGKDPRHREVKVVRTERLPFRRFPDWALAYQGPSLFVDRHVKRLFQQEIDPAEQTVNTDQLINLLLDLAADSGPP